MPWIIFASINLFTQSLANLFQRIFMKENEGDPVLYSIIFQLLLTVITGIFAFSKGFVFPPIDRIGPTLLLGGILYAIGTLFGFKAAKRIGAGEMSIISAFGAIVPIIFAIIFLKESFGFSKILGTLLILISVLILYGKNKLSQNSGMWYALGMTIFYGLGVICDAYNIHRYNAISYTPVMSFIPFVLLSIVKPQSYIHLKTFFDLKKLRNMVLFCLFYSVSAIMYYLAIEKGANASQMIPISRSSIILTVLLALIFLNERRDFMKKILSAGIVIIGTLLLL